MVRSRRRLLEVGEVTNTSFDNNCEYARSIIELAVKSCSEASFADVCRHGKSPCFLRLGVFALVDVDSASVDFAVVDVREITE
jgi:predicted nucleic acid-binding Zn finger protein